MSRMRLGWYAGASTALAGTVVLSAFHQRANFYASMVYLAQSNFCLLVLVNFTLLLYSSFIYALTRLFFGPLRAIEVEQLTERAWFAITETCLAMTIFREEIGAWFLVMFTGLVTGKVWGWIGDGRVEIFEQQPPANPRLFHLRLTLSLALSFFYDIYILRYTINTVIQQARPNMMVMFLFEFAVLATCSWRTAARYALSLTEHNIQESQKRKLLAERRSEIREQREAILRRRQEAAATGEDAPEDEPLPSEDDIDEMDIEVPGWSAKGEWVLWLDLFTDLVKLGLYVTFFFMLLTFYGLPIHIMRDLFMTSRDFIKRLGALLRYRRAIQEMNRYPDATEEELTEAETCIICREEMRPWDPANNPAAIDRVRPKKLPCGHILHLGCLKSWLERQQVCPTCRRPVTGDSAGNNAGNAAGIRIQLGVGRQPLNQPGDRPNQGNGANAGQQDAAAAQQRPGGPRIFRLGPLRVGFGANGQQVRELAHQFGLPPAAAGAAVPPPPTVAAAAPDAPATQTTGIPAPASSTSHQSGDSMQNIGSLLSQADQMIQREIQQLQNTQQELQTLQLLTAELHRLRLRQQQHDQAQNAPNQTAPSPSQFASAPPQLAPYPFQPPQVTIPQGPMFPGFPAVPPRIQSPLMARHGALPGATTIPSGSSELPEGVVIPPGWSLLPLQRLDGSSTSAQNSTQPSPQTGPQGNNTESVNPTQQLAAQSLPLSSETQETGSRSHPSGGSGIPRVEEPPLSAQVEAQTQRIPQPSQSPRAASMAQFTRVVDQPLVVAPSPRMPHWGGSAQLFSDSPRLDPRATSPQTDATRNSLTSDSVADRSSLDAAQASNSQNAGNSENEAQAQESLKGKAKAVTVEDVEENEKDQDDETE